MKKISKIFLIILATSMFLVGCSKDDGTGETNTSSGGGNGSSKEITVISREEGSGTRSAFTELVGIEDEDGNDSTTEEAVIQNNTEAVISTIAGDESSIGYISLGSLNDNVKALKIDGAEANSDNVKDGSYKISRPFNIVTKDDSNEDINDFISFILSSDGQAIVEEEGYISGEEDAKAYEGKDIKANITIAGSSSVTPVMEKLVEAYKEINPEVSIQVNLSDSTTGVQSVNDGIAQIGMVSRELKDSEKSLKKTTIALDGIAVIVNKDSATDEMSLETLKKIYTEEVVNWEDVK